MFAARMALLPIRVFSRDADIAIRQGLFAFFGKGVLRITGMRITVRGRQPVPPFFMVSNHLTFLDVFVLASELGCVFVSNEDLAGWPLFGYMAKQMNTIFIDRAKRRDAVRVNRLIGGALEEGHGVVIFPEGGVSQTGELMPFKAALLDPPARLGLPVHYAAIEYRTPPGSPPASEMAIWKHGVNFFRHYLALAALPYFEVWVTFGNAPVVGRDRRELALALHAAVKSAQGNRVLEGGVIG